MLPVPLHQFLQAGLELCIASCLPACLPARLLACPPACLPSDPPAQCLPACLVVGTSAELHFWASLLPASPPPWLLLLARVQADTAAKLSADARQQLAAAVAAGVSARYLHLADDTLRCAVLAGALPRVCSFPPLLLLLVMPQCSDACQACAAV